MKDIESIKLSEIFRLVPKPKFILGTTYTLSLAFFESVVYPCIKDKTQLSSCLIICDMLGYQHTLSEAAALRYAGQEYLAVPAPIPDCFHPKVWLIVGAQEAVLLCGSGNLTQSGFMTNAEYFDAFYFTVDSPPHSRFLEELDSFIKGLRSMWPIQDSRNILAVENLSQISGSLDAFKGSQDKEKEYPKLIHSFTKKPLIEQLPETFKVKELHVAAPFFGNSIEGLRALTSRYKCSSVHVFPAIHNDKATDVPLKILAGSVKGIDISPLSTKNKNAFAHLKLYGAVIDEQNSWICCTSANCTKAAWTGTNIEAGIVRMVSPSECRKYFKPAKGALPEGKLEYNTGDSKSAMIAFWASETEEGIDISISSDSQKYLPLKNVTLTLRAGSYLASCRKESMFKDSLSTSISMASFEKWRRPRNMTLLLDIEAEPAHGEKIKGRCIIENRILLVADPNHRRALRGAFALLDPEGIPGMGEISAIVSMAQELFEGNIIHPVDANIQAQDMELENTENENSPSIAIWPPRPAVQEYQHAGGNLAFGRIKWFQRILQILFGDQESDPSARTQSSEEDDSDTEIKPDKVIDENVKIKEEMRAALISRELGNRAIKDYEWLHEKLVELCPTERQAKNLWAAAIMTFLLSLATLRKARSKTPEIEFEITTDYMIKDFISLMLEDRKLDDDYCFLTGDRYYKYKNKRPALAVDLCDNFKVKIDSALSIIMLGFLADWKLRSKEGELKMAWPRYVKLVCDSSFVADDDSRSKCRYKWRQYVADDSKTFTDEDFNRVFDWLCNLRQGV